MVGFNTNNEECALLIAGEAVVWEHKTIPRWLVKLALHGGDDAGDYVDAIGIGFGKKAMPLYEVD